MSACLRFIAVLALVVFVAPPPAAEAQGPKGVKVDRAKTGPAKRPLPPDRSRCLALLRGYLQGKARPRKAVRACPGVLTHLDPLGQTQDQDPGQGMSPPPTSGCPECWAAMRVDAEQGDLHVELTDAWDPSDTTITNPYLVAEWPDGTEQWISLPVGKQWAPKQSFVVEDVAFKHPQSKNTTADLMASGALSLVMTVKRDGKTTADVSKVIMK